MSLTIQDFSKKFFPERIGDPLNIGIINRPQAPPDPDIFITEEEEKEYSLSLFDDNTRAKIIKNERPMKINDVRQFLVDNSKNDDLDPELLIFIDARIDYKIFIVDDNLYTREELYENFALYEFNIQPEVIFSQQEIGEFQINLNEKEYIMRDVGNEIGEFCSTLDLVRKVKNPRPANRIVKTKIYIGRESWKDFITLQRIVKTSIRIKKSQMLTNSEFSVAPNLLLLDAAATAAAAATATSAAAVVATSVTSAAAAAAATAPIFQNMASAEPIYNCICSDHIQRINDVIERAERLIDLLDQKKNSYK